MSDHLTERGEFKSDKYPWCPEGFFPMKLSDKHAQDLIEEYGERTKDEELKADIEVALRQAGYIKEKAVWEMVYKAAGRALKRAAAAIHDISDWSGSSGNWPLQDASVSVDLAIEILSDKCRACVVQKGFIGAVLEDKHHKCKNWGQSKT